MEIQIRIAELPELSLIMEWRMRVLKEVFCLPEDTDMTEPCSAKEQYYREHLQDSTHTAVFACVGERIIGCGEICYQTEMPSPDNPNGKCGYLMNIYTLPEYRRMGVGREIVSFLIKDAQLKNVKKLSLESSEMAEKLYQSTGFLRNEHFYLKYL